MILGTICTRKGSKGVPGKAMRELGGCPLIGHTAKVALLSKAFDKLIVSTDDEEVARYMSYLPVQWRPEILATDTASKWDVFRYIAEQNGLKPDDILVDLDVGCPLRETQDITACIDKLKSVQYDVVCTAYESERNPYFNMVEGYEDRVFVVGDGEYNHKITRRQDAPQVWSLSPAVFAIKVSALVKYEHWSTVDRMGIVVIPRERAWDIDTNLDFEIAEFLMRRK
jgi:CMP-N,N'-diacetyllegionaminic acid synthase